MKIKTNTKLLRQEVQNQTQKSDKNVVSILIWPTAFEYVASPRM